MKPSDVFDIVLERVREYQALEGRITAIRADASAPDGPPKVGNRMLEYIADFEKAGRRALKPWPRRWVMFRLYFVNAPLDEKKREIHYKRVARLMKLKESTFWWWSGQIKKEVGAELRRSGLFPPRKYAERTLVEEELDD